MSILIEEYVGMAYGKDPASDISYYYYYYLTTPSWLKAVFALGEGFLSPVEFPEVLI